MRGHHGEQHLRGADVAGRLLAADVLLAGLQREPVGRRAVGVDATRRPAGRAGCARGRRAPPCSPACGPPKPIGTPNRWVVPTATSAPNSPGGAAAGSARAGRRRPRRSAPRVVRGRGERRPGRAPRRSRRGTAAGRRRPVAPPAAARRLVGVGDAASGRRRRPRCRAARPGSRITARVCGRTSSSTSSTASWRDLAGPAHQRHRLGGRGRLVEQRGARGRQAGQVARRRSGS